MEVSVFLFEPKSKAVNLPVDLLPYPHLWSQAVGSDQKDKIANTSGGHEHSPKGGWPLPQRQGEEL